MFRSVPLQVSPVRSTRDREPVSPLRSPTRDRESLSPTRSPVTRSPAGRGDQTYVTAQVATAQNSTPVHTLCTIEAVAFGGHSDSLDALKVETGADLPTRCAL